MEAHPDTRFGDLKFIFKTIRHHNSDFRRQIDEAVEIKLSKGNPLRVNVNNKLEYNRCILPDLEPGGRGSARMGVELGQNPQTLQLRSLLVVKRAAWEYC